MASVTAGDGLTWGKELLGESCAAGRATPGRGRALGSVPRTHGTPGTRLRGTALRDAPGQSRVPGVGGGEPRPSGPA